MDALCEKIERLANEFGLNQSQVTQVFKHAHSDGLAYIEEKAAVVRSQPRENAGRAFRAALKGDWKLPKASAPKAKRSARKPEPEGWREALRAIADERYPNADPDAWPDWKALPGDLKAEVGEYLGRQRGA